MEDFEQLEFLGRGGFASVYLVRRLNSPSLYAVKRILKSKVVTDQQKSRLEVENFILQQVTSPFLCRGFETFETTEEFAFLQEYVEGRTLYECVWNYKDTGKFPENVAKFFAAQLVLALGELHAVGYMHRDFKSGNVLIGKDGFVKVIDFGLAKKVLVGETEEDGRTHSICGTHYIMAPEIMSRQPYGVGVDWWSLGVVIYEMVVGHPPWEYQCPPNSTIDEYFQHITFIARSPFQNAGDIAQRREQELSSDLQTLISGLLTINFHKRLGINGATEVMHHTWFRDVNWEHLKTKDASINLPYSAQADYNADRIRTHPSRIDSLSSAESIDPEENAKYFAEF
ncbi:unnamed protein product [Peronospora farinosa]|uniref:cAMP-dependent protein kinase n=1 Tax=Peronospora farinosa TaxID=134698 RepID=A0ABN8CAH3_9STRA|nr:unnamed protein product [Peronospora farinosa]